MELVRKEISKIENKLHQLVNMSLKPKDEYELLQNKILRTAYVKALVYLKHCLREQVRFR